MAFLHLRFIVRIARFVHYESKHLIARRNENGNNKVKVIRLPEAGRITSSSNKGQKLCTEVIYLIANFSTTVYTV